MFEKGRPKKGLFLGFVLVAFAVFPVISMGKEPTSPSRETKSQSQSSSKQDSSGITFSDVGQWVQRSGNRVGEELSKAASKTATAIKKAASGGKAEEQSEGSR